MFRGSQQSRSAGMRRRALILVGLMALLALAVIAGGCGRAADDETQPAWTIPGVRRALEAQGLPLLPTGQAGFLGPSTVPEKGATGRHRSAYRRGTSSPSTGASSRAEALVT
jgi:hypothetical protein